MDVVFQEIVAMDYGGTINLGDVVEFLLTQIIGTAYGHPAPEKAEFMQYCELEEKPDCEDHFANQAAASIKNGPTTGVISILTFHNMFAIMKADSYEGNANG